MTALANGVMPNAVTATYDPGIVVTTLAVPVPLSIIFMVISCDFEM